MEISHANAESDVSTTNGWFYKVCINGALLISISMVGSAFYSGEFKTGFIILIGGIIFHLSAPFAWNVGNWFRRFILPDSYFTYGTSDAFNKKIFWLVGPQWSCFTSAFLILVLLPFLVFLKDIDKNKRNNTLSSNTQVIETQPMLTVTPQVVKNDLPETLAPILTDVEVKNTSSLPAEIITADTKLETKDVINKSEIVSVAVPGPNVPVAVPASVDVAWSPSFDCAKVTTGQERLICGSKELSEFDVKLSLIYRQALERAPNKDLLRTSQREWRKFKRDACSDVECILASYKSRIDEITSFN